MVLAGVEKRPLSIHSDRASRPFALLELAVFSDFIAI
jgi:hypothetical protein